VVHEVRQALPEQAKPLEQVLSVPTELHEPAPSQAKSVSTEDDLQLELHGTVAPG
jgi:hypothetical protein